MLTPGTPSFSHDPATERIYEEATTMNTKDTKKNLS
jgi:hypothetical protein